MKTLQQRFDDKYIPVPEAGCWAWIGATDRRGYGHIKSNGRMVGAHRVSYELHVGRIPRGNGYHGTCVLHKCDNPGCVNPSHLFLGTVKENQIDMKNKGRSLRGEKNKKAVLTDNDVRAIRADNRSQARIALDYGVDNSQISLIKNRKGWGHVI